MGIDVHGLNFLRFAATQRPLGDVATLGRQGLNIAPYRLVELLSTEPPLPPVERWSESLLTSRLGARSVESYDNSGFEGATHLADLNRPIEPPRRYDTVVDAGTLEHIFDVRQALANVAALCVPGGQILHVLPANNQNGHGFWQFSPELFLSLYSAANGYRDTRVFLASELIESSWYEVRPPPPGQRVDLTSLLRTIVLVRTVRGEVVRDDRVQQSDYVERWTEDAPRPVGAGAGAGAAATVKAAIDRHHAVARLVRGTWYKARSLAVVGSQLSRRHPHLQRVRVADLVAEQ